MTSIHLASIRSGFIVALVLLLGAGCGVTQSQVYTPRKKGFIAPARTTVLPTGTAVSLRIRSDGSAHRLRGELIEVRTDGFIILSETSSLLTLVPYDLMTRMRFGTDVGISRNINRHRGIPPLKEDSLRQTVLARYSRYPFGLGDAQLQLLLDALGQSGLVIFES